MLPEYEGKSLPHPQSLRFLNSLTPRNYDPVVHVCQNNESALHELPALLRGENVKPSSGVGSNLDSSAPKPPKALFVGGGWTGAAIEQMRGVDTVMTSIPYVHPGATFQAAQSGPPPMEKIIAGVKKVFAEQRFPEGRMENGVFNF